MAGHVAGASGPSRSPTGFGGLTIQDVEFNLQQFWEIDEIQGDDKSMVNEQNECLNHFEQHFRLADDGKFVVKLPFKVDRALINDNYDNALRSLKRLENEFLKHPKMKTAYVDFVNEYIQMGHMTKVEPTSGPKYFIPYRAVFREESTTTPLRVVFNASSCKKNEI